MHAAVLQYTIGHKSRAQKKIHTFYYYKTPRILSGQKYMCTNAFFYEESTMKQKLYIHYIFYRSTKKICAIKRVVDTQSSLWEGETYNIHTKFIYNNNNSNNNNIDTIKTEYFLHKLYTFCTVFLLLLLRRIVISKACI